LWALAVAIPAAAVVGYYVYYRDFPAHHFEMVTESVLYRSGQPSADGWRAIKDKYGIKTVISLRESAPDSDWRRTEIRFCLQNKIELVDIGVSHDVTDEHWKEFLGIVTDPQKHPVLVHCQAGSVRTGAVIAGYRIAVQGWSYEEAVEDAERFGIDIERRKLYRIFLRRLENGAIPG
jgi:protein tyrosine/serine phosphatase